MLFLSYNHLKGYLSLLIENNLLEYNGKTKIFRTTEKGLKFLSIQNSIGELLETSKHD
jgi:predicted transcriptional regulator